MHLEIPDWIVQNVAWGTVAAGGIGYATYLMKRKKRDDGAKFIGRRRDDELVERLISQNETLMARFMEAYQENTGAIQGSINALRAIAGEVQTVAAKQTAADVSLQVSFRGLHERLDRLVEREA